MILDISFQEKGITPLPEKNLDAVRELKEPSNARDLSVPWSWGHNNRFIPFYADICRTLNNLINKECSF